jgi:hypothetical protein
MLMVLLTFLQKQRLLRLKSPCDQSSISSHTVCEQDSSVASPEFALFSW